MNKKAKPTAPLSLRLSEELHARLEEVATRTRLKKYNLALLAIEAAVEAIEQNGFSIVCPIKFDVKQIAVAKPAYPPHREEITTMEERAESAKTPKKRTA